MSLEIYLAQDRRRSLATGRPLPDRTHGTALFADISGFTPLTEMLRITSVSLAPPYPSIIDCGRHLKTAVFQAVLRSRTTRKGCAADCL